MRGSFVTTIDQNHRYSSLSSVVELSCHHLVLVSILLLPVIVCLLFVSRRSSLVGAFLSLLVIGWPWLSSAPVGGGWPALVVIGVICQIWPALVVIGIRRSWLAGLGCHWHRSVVVGQPWLSLALVGQSS